LREKERAVCKSYKKISPLSEERETAVGGAWKNDINLCL